MDIHTFRSAEEMQQALIKWRAEANAGLALAQTQITFGDRWVRFVDVGAQVVEFGLVYPKDLILGAAVGAGESNESAWAELESVEEAMEQGYLHGMAYSALNPEGEIGSTHRSLVWPIEARLMDDAMAVQWRILEMSDWAKVLLQVAYLNYSGHTRRQQRLREEMDG